KLQNHSVSSYNKVTMAVATKVTSKSAVKSQPFLKWAGGKTQLLDELLKRVPADYNVYFEPFIGGGALYFAIAPDEAVIADINDDLVNAYQVVRDNPDELLEALSKYKNEKDFYYSVRSQDQNKLS